MKRVTQQHLRTHGFTTAQYRRLHPSTTRAAPSGARIEDGPPPGAVASIAPGTLDTITDELLADAGFVRRLADEVGGALFTGSVRHRLRVALVSMIHTRLAMHGEAVQLLDKARKEVSQPWRLEQGGPNGGPTDTKDLINVLHAALAEVKTSEDLLLRTVKTAIDESKQDKHDPTIQSDLDRFTGEAERIPVPSGLTPSEREGIRNLMSMLERSVQVTRHIEGTATVSPARDADEAPADSAADGSPPTTDTPTPEEPEMTNTQESGSTDPILDF